MIGIWQAYSNIYLYVMGAAMLAAFGLPLLLVPLSWARLFRWVDHTPGNMDSFLV